MQLNTLKPAPGSTKSRKRIARGQGSGKGGTSTRGHNGAQSRSGYKSKRGFEGGQLPLQRRLPRYGFKNPTRVAYKAINLTLIQQVVEKEKSTSIDLAILVKHGIVNKSDRYKILGDGDLKTKVDVSADAFSASARATIEQLGGKVTVVNIHA
jgi:large subunit ribosomal protein L15